MIVANERGFSERSIHTAVVGEGFYLIIIFGSEIDKLEPGQWPEYFDRWYARLLPGGRLVVAESSDGIGDMPMGGSNHSWEPEPL